MLRLERRLTQQEIARRLGMSQGTYSLIETGYREIEGDELKQLARVLRVDKSELGFNVPTGVIQ